MNAAPQTRPATLGPDSLIWRYFGDTRVLFFLGTGLIVQVAHPVIGKAVGEHSNYRTDAYGRLQRSLELLWPVVYNDAEGAREYGKRLVDRHRDPDYGHRRKTGAPAWMSPPSSSNLAPERLPGIRNAPGRPKILTPNCRPCSLL